VQEDCRGKILVGKNGKKVFAALQEGCQNVIAEKDRLSVDEVRTTEDLIQLRGEWNDLLRRSLSATPFQSPEWILTWWKYFGGGRLRVISLRSGGRLVGLAPLFISDPDEEEKRVIRFIGTGITDYLDFIMEPGLGQAGAAVVFDHLGRTASEWDFCDFQELRPESTLLEAPFPAELHTHRHVQEFCPVLLLPRTAEEYYRTLTRSFATRVARARKALSNSGAELVEANAETLPFFLKELFRLHGAAWENRSQTGVLSDSTIRAFHSEVAARLTTSGHLRLFGIRKEDNLLAVIYALSSGSRLFFYIGGHDPAYARLSPGTVLIALVIELAISEGFHEIDFLRGDEKYKFKWGARTRKNYRLLAWQPGLSQLDVNERS
jgi:CelD/BcsL family acetyltransferase involved in cellulose biosynthesis